MHVCFLPGTARPRDLMSCQPRLRGKGRGRGDYIKHARYSLHRSPRIVTTALEQCMSASLTLLSSPCTSHSVIDRERCPDPADLRELGPPSQRRTVRTIRKGTCDYIRDGVFNARHL